MISVKIFQRGDKTLEQLQDELNDFFHSIGTDVTVSRIDMKEDHILAVYNNVVEELPGGRDEQVRAMEDTLREMTGQWIAKETNRRFWAAENLKGLGGTQKREMVTQELRRAEIESETQANQIRIIRQLIEEAKAGGEAGIVIAKA